MNFSSLKPLVYNSQNYNALMDYLAFRIERESKVLEDLTDPVQVHRSQGKIKAYRMLQTLREEVLATEKE